MIDSTHLTQTTVLEGDRATHQHTPCLSGKRPVDAFSQHRRPCAVAFLALFGRDCVPARSTRSCCVAALTAELVEAWQMLFLDDLRSQRTPCEHQPCGLTNRTGTRWKVFDSDETRAAAIPRALPTGDDLPAEQRRLDEVGAAGSTGRLRGDVVRPRSTVLPTHSSQWLGRCGYRGNSEDREEMRRAVEAIQASVQAYQ